MKDRLHEAKKLLSQWRNKEVLPDMFKELVDKTDKFIKEK